MKGKLFFLAYDQRLTRINVNKNVQSLTYLPLRQGSPILILDREITVLNSRYILCLTSKGIVHETPENLSLHVHDYERQQKNIRVNGLKLEKINKNHIDTK